MTENQSFPNAERRKLCRTAKDVFFTCLDNNGEDETKCTQMKQAFEDNCPKTWVKYFVRNRGFQKYKDDVQKRGFIPAEEEEQKT